MSKDIKVSIILPIYNVEAYLEECIGSLLNQTLKEIEIIAINDGSTDRSKEIIDKYRHCNKNIIYLEQKNQGVSVARNLGLQYARGKYVLYMDSDDYLEHECLQLLYDKAEKTHSSIVIYSHREIYERKQENLIVPVIINIDDTKKYKGHEVADMVLRGKFLGTPWNKLFRRDDLIREGIEFEPGRYVQDWYPIFVQIYKSQTISFLNKPLYSYRIRETSTTGKKTQKNIDDYTHAATQIISYAKKEKLNENSIRVIKCSAIATILRRYYELNLLKKKNDYRKIEERHKEVFEISPKQILECKDIGYRIKIELMAYKLRLYHVLKKYIK